MDNCEQITPLHPRVPSLSTCGSIIDSVMRILTMHFSSRYTREYCTKNICRKSPKASATHFVLPMCTFLLSACGGSDSSSDNNASIPPARAIAFTDTDPDTAEIGGVVAIKNAVDETSIDDYVVYWSNAAGGKLSSLFSLPKSTSPLNGSVPDNTPIHDGATHLLVVTKNATQEMASGVSTELIDNHSASVLPLARSLRFKDTDSDAGQISGTVVVAPAEDESDILGYSLHWANDEGQVLSPEQIIATTPKAASLVRELSITVPDDTPIPNLAQQLVVAAYNDQLRSTAAIAINLLDFASNAQGRGPGGNERTGRYDYGLAGRPTLSIQSSPANDTPQCLLDNGLVMVIDMDSQVDTRPYTTPDNPQTVDDDHFSAFSFSCGANNENDHKTINGGFSPLNDAFYFGNVTFNMFYDYLNNTPLTEKIRLRVHYGDNAVFASWDGAYANFGDGDLVGTVTTRPMHPLTVLDVVAHEIAHGFTRRYSNLFGDQASAINEAFSDMVGEAAEHYLYGQTDWQHNNTRADSTRALRYFQYPSDDNASIESVNDYDPALSAHHNAGIFRKAFYLLAQTPGSFSSDVEWTLPLALKVFALANQYCWQKNSTFEQAADCVLNESFRVLYDVTPDCFGEETEPQCQNDNRKIGNDIRKAFAQVDINLDIGGTQALFDVQTGILEARFSDASKAGDGAAVDGWQWDFGDGTPQSSEQFPTHIYAAEGRYTVTLTITDSDNNTDAYSREIFVAEDYCRTVASNSSIYWVAGVSVGEFTQYSGNSLRYRLFSTDSLGLVPGTQMPLELLSGQANDADTVDGYWQIWIDYNRDGKFDHANELAFQNTATGSLQGSIALPDNLPSGNSRMRIVAKTNNYLSRVCGSAAIGQVEDYNVTFQEKAVDINANFAAEVETNSTPTGTLVSFYNHSQVITASALRWDFGDGSALVQNVVHPVHTYAAADTYTVTLMVTTPDNREFKVEKDVTIP